MRTRFPASVLGLALLFGSVSTTLTTSVVTAPSAHASAWTVTGIDVSKYQQPPYGSAPVDWSAVGNTGVDFAIVKATEGKKEVDPAFVANASGAIAAGITIGMYHVATPSTSPDDPKIEADHFVSVADPIAGNLIPALDIEINRVPSGMTSAELQAWARAWLNRVTNRLGVRPMVYGSIYMFQTLLGNTTWFADHGYPLWLARWGPLPSPLPANDWQGQGWTFWQWSSTGTINGITTAVDRDRFVGADLQTATIASLTAQPGAGGSIADGSGRLACAASSTCSAIYSPNEPVELTATPDPGYTFVSWGGACAGTASATCSLTALGQQTATATFSHRLRVHVDGTGAGTVVSTPVGISCPGTCGATFPSGSVVTLTAAPDSWSDLTWSGDCTGSDPNGCAVTLDEPREVIATFDDLGPALATIKPPGARNGPIRVRFDEAVHHVNGDNLVLRLASGKRLDARLTCFDVKGARTPCGTGAVRTAELQPTAPLKPGRSYVAIVDPSRVTPIQDRAQNATPRVRRTFTV
jgi:GH25 family lysozyme M1 (1,4-beta-N-acetylmuramidase)